MKKYKLIYLYIFLLFVSCGEYPKVLKSTDVALKYESAVKYFINGKYNHSISLIEEAKSLIKGTIYMEKSLYLLAHSYYAQKNYILAAEYFKNYYTSFPCGEYTELVCFYLAHSLYLGSPEVQLDQSITLRAIQEFQNFLKNYPCSKQKYIAQYYLYELKEKLVFKELIAVRLYYNLGNYILYPFKGGNYLSCIITAQNALQICPFSKYREDFMYYIFKSKYNIALQCEKGVENNYHDLIDEYYSYVKDYPAGKYLKEIKKLYNNIVKHLKFMNL